MVLAFDMHNCELHASQLPKFITFNDKHVYRHVPFCTSIAAMTRDLSGRLRNAATHHITRSDFVIVHYLFNTKYSDGTLLQKMAELLMRSYRKAKILDG